MSTGQQVFHIENSYASGHKKRPRGPRSTSAMGFADTSGTEVVVPPSVQNGPETTMNSITLLDTIPRGLHVDLISQATMYYINFHLQTLEDVSNISKGVFDDLLPTWTSKANCPILGLAASSMALAVFARTKRHSPAAIEASKQYHQLLQIMQSTIPFLNEANIDSCLLAIVFMGRYEEVIHQSTRSDLNAPLATTLQSFSHHDGALAMLKAWKDQFGHIQPATDVVKHTRRGLLRSALLRNLALPEWMQEGTSFGEDGLELQYDRIIVRIVNVRQKSSWLLEDEKLLHASHELILLAKKLNKEAQNIDQALQDWTSRFPNGWGYRRHTLSDPHPWPMRDFYSKIVYSYASPAYAAVWNLYYATRMLINSSRLKVLNFLRSTSHVFASEQHLECLSHLNILTSDLASSLPFCLQRFTITDNPQSSSESSTIMLNTKEDLKPYLTVLTVWPLTIASSLEGVEEGPKLWFRSEISRLGRVLGVGVLECAETDQWLEL